MEDRNINTGERYKNIIELRSVKLRWMLEKLPALAKNCILMTYEDLEKNPLRELEKIRAAGVATKADRIVQTRVFGYKRTRFPFFLHKLRSKQNLVSADLVWNHPDLDVSLENQVGYRWKSNPESIQPNSTAIGSNRNECLN